MTVSELIETLRKLPADMPVSIEGHDWNDDPDNYFVDKLSIRHACDGTPALVIGWSELGQPVDKWLESHDTPT